VRCGDLPFPAGCDGVQCDDEKAAEQSRAVSAAVRSVSGEVCSKSSSKSTFAVEEGSSRQSCLVALVSFRSGSGQRPLCRQGRGYRGLASRVFLLTPG
jgi:hypothetical protein